MSKATCAVTVFITANLETVDRKITVEPTGAQIQLLGDVPGFDDLSLEEKASIFRIMARIGLSACVKKLTAAEAETDIPSHDKLTVMA